MKPSVTITVEWGYELHSLTLNPENWQTVQDGNHLKVTGEGYEFEGECFTDYWEFNLAEKGSLKVLYCSNKLDSGCGTGEGFNATIADALIEEH